MQKNLIIKGANENNLKNVDMVIPRDKFVYRNTKKQISYYDRIIRFR